MSTNAKFDAPHVTACFERDGCYIAHELFPAAECEQLKTEAVRIMREHARPTSTVYVGVAVVSPRFRALADDPRMVAILRAIMPDGVMFMSDKIVFKSAEQTFASPWHMDAAYWPNTRPKLSVWIALDDAMAENGTLIVVPGSHKRDLSHRTSDMHDTNGEFNNVITNKPWAAEDEVVCEVKRGSAIFFSDRLAHASCTNTAGLDRYTIISTYHAPAEDDEFDKHFPARHLIVPRPAAATVR
jgi:ectoine hydroxylase-related dioxygenase (phytanoyl-CoA dioxygenase family)